jgi:antitoxin ParD1/3/4
MAKNTSIILGDHYDQFIAEQISAGYFGTASEAVRAGLRLLEERQHNLQALRRTLLEAERSGIVEDFSFDKLQRTLDQSWREPVDPACLATPPAKSVYRPKKT